MYLTSHWLVKHLSFQRLSVIFNWFLTDTDIFNWFLTDTEQAEAQLLQAARNLLATGMEIAQVAEILGLSEAQVQAVQSSH